VHLLEEFEKENPDVNITFLLKVLSSDPDLLCEGFLLA
jgi:hypothetical protein